MKHNRKGYIDPLPYEVYEQLKHFRDSYDAILNYHEKLIEPVLRTHGMDIVQVCHLFLRCLSDEAFNVYKRYAMLAPEAIEILGTYYLKNKIKEGGLFIEAIDKVFVFPLDDYIEAPIKHLQKYDRIVKRMMKIIVEEVMDDRVQVELTRIVTTASLQLENFQRTIQETFKIHRKRSLAVS